MFPISVNGITVSHHLLPRGLRKLLLGLPLSSLLHIQSFVNTAIRYTFLKQTFNHILPLPTAFGELWWLPLASEKSTLPSQALFWITSRTWESNAAPYRSLCPGPGDFSSCTHPSICLKHLQLL